MLTLALALAALLTGTTGSWSPCGLSAVATFGPRAGAQGRARLVAASCAAFTAGTLLGGLVTFGGLALVGAALGGGTAPAIGLAAAVLLLAAALDLRGLPVRPQVRRQVPEPWRRLLPLPVAALGYGTLLGLGFTTWVLSFSLPALAATSLALGDPALGLVLGLAFGIGRALPVVVLAPLQDRPVGLRAAELMLERPSLLRGARRADALTVALGAGLLVVVGG